MQGTHAQVHGTETRTQATTTKVGVLSLQGAFAAHARVLADLGADPVQVRTPDHLDDVEALVLPGGESTTMSMLLESSGLFDAVAGRLAEGMAAFHPELGDDARLHELFLNQVV